VPVILARLPEVTEAPIGNPISLKLSWVLNFRWQDGLRRLVQMEPNYLAGGVLALVVFLLVMITMRNRDGASAAVAGDALATAPQATVPAEPPVAAVKQQSDSANLKEAAPIAQTPVYADAAVPRADSAEVRSIAPAPVQDPLAGIYYPRTQFAAPAGVSFEQVAGKPVAAFAAVTSPFPTGEVHTPMRERIEQHQQPAPQADPVARLDGIITRSR
jgi:hypothetical protein